MLNLFEFFSSDLTHNIFSKLVNKLPNSWHHFFEIDHAVHQEIRLSVYNDSETSSVIAEFTNTSNLTNFNIDEKIKVLESLK